MMIITPRFIVLLFVLVAGTILPAEAQFLRPHEPFDSTKAQKLALTPGEIVVTDDAGESIAHKFQFEFADTDSKRSTGLMHRAEIGPDIGMLFDFKRDRMVAMWMRNTFIPLDMLFLDEHGEIVTIAENTVPHSEKTVSSRVRVRSVLEVAAGTVQRLVVQVGDHVKHNMFER